ncbi:MAG: PAS domain S-box protein [Thermodesulfobacteriota bacterium]
MSKVGQPFLSFLPLEKFLDFIGVMIVVISADQKVQLVNKKACTILGYEEKEIIGKNWFDNFLPERIRTEIKKVFIKIISGEMQSSAYVENPVLTKSGEEKLIAWHNTFLTDESGKIIASLSSGEDITERRRFEEALRQGEEKYRAIVEGMEEGYYEVDLAGNFTFVNEALARMVGYHKEELIGMNNREYMDEETAKKVFKIFNQVYKTGEPYRWIDWEIISRDGRKRIHEGSVSLMRNTQGEVIGFRGVVRDITERKEAELALREAEEQYRRLFEISTSAIIIRDQQGIIRLANPIAMKMLKASKPEDVIGRPYLDFVHPDDRSGSIARIQLQTKAALGEAGIDPSQIAAPPREHRLVTKEGNTIYVESTGVAFFHKGEVWIQGIFQDITERKKAENDLRRSEESARRLAEENAVMAEIGKIVSSSLDIQQIYHLFAKELSRLIKFDRVAVNIIDPAQYTFTIPYVWGPKVPQRTEDQIVPLAGTASEEIFKTRQSILVDEENRKDVAKKFPGLLPIFNAGLLSVMMTPLVYQNKVIGVFNVQATRPNAYTESDLKLVERVANQIAGAIANSLLFNEHKKAEEALRESEEKYRNLFSYSLDAVYLSTKEGKFIDFNQATVDLFGYSRDELFTINIRQLYANPEDRPRFQREIEQKGALKEYEVKFRRKDGTEIDCLLTATLRFDKDGRIIGYQGIIRDITQRKKLEEEREKLIAELQEALNKIRTLSGLVPICASCKKIRDDKGYWNQLEIYIQEHTQAEFSHGLCPDCMKKLYPDIFPSLQEEKEK